MINKFVNSFKPVYDNTVDAWVPEVWANESIAILLENMVIANLVHTDFKNEIAQHGDVVNTRKPSTFSGKRKGINDNVTIQDASATNIAVKLDQHLHVSFLIRDGEESKSFQSLVAEYLNPAVVAIAQSIDKILLGQAIQFKENLGGGLGRMASVGSKESLLDLRNVMNKNKAHATGRNLILTPDMETELLKDDAFTDADRVGDEGTAMREASLGQKAGFSTFMSQNNLTSPKPTNGTSDTNTSQAEVKGSLTVNVDSVSGMAASQYIVVTGDDRPRRIVSISTLAVTIETALEADVADNAVVQIINAATIDQAAGYAIGYDGFIEMDSADIVASTSELYTGMHLEISGYWYTVIDTEDISGPGHLRVQLDRPLEAAIADDAAVYYYPHGDYGFAFHRNAISFVSRPLAKPKDGTGALSAVVDYDGVGIRVVITYDGDKQGHLVTVDVLCGVKVLDTDLGGLLYN